MLIALNMHNLMPEKLFTGSELHSSFTKHTDMFTFA
jgi:hypothetical protein